MAASRNHRRKQQGKPYYHVVRKDGALAPRVCGLMTFADGELRVRRGQALRVLADGKLIGFELVDTTRPQVADSEASSCVISRAETELLAGRSMRGGQSRTAGLTDRERAERGKLIDPRTLKYLPEEDAVELATIKQACFTGPVSVAGDKAVRVYPKG